MLDPKYIPLFIGGFIAWICFMIFVGWITSRGKNEGSSFLTGGGNLGFFLIFCTVGATMIGTGSSMGAIGNGFNHGWGGAIYGLGASAGILSMLLFTKAKNKGFLTMSEEAQYYYGGKKIIRQVMGFMMFVIEIIWLGNHLNGGAKYLAYVTQLPDVTCKIITVLGFGIYVFIGGYMAVVTTDAVQFIAILIGFLTIAVRAIPLAGGYQNVVDTFTAAGKPGAMTFYGLGSYGVMAAIALVLSTAMGVIGTPTHRTRIYTSKDEKTARKAFLGQGILLFGWIGLSILYLLNPGKPFNAHDLRASLPGVSKVVASIAVYIILFATVGLPLGTFLFLLLFFSLMRYRDIRRMIPFALLGAGLTWLVFEKILGVVVPQPFWVGLF